MILGCVMEVYSIMILTLPIIFPIVMALGFDPIWFGVMIVIVLEVGLITPPIGLNVFVLKGSAPGIPVETIFRGIWPFLGMALVRWYCWLCFRRSRCSYLPTCRWLRGEGAKAEGQLVFQATDNRNGRIGILPVRPLLFAIAGWAPTIY